MPTSSNSESELEISSSAKGSGVSNVSTLVTPRSINMFEKLLQLGSSIMTRLMSLILDF